MHACAPRHAPMRYVAIRVCLTTIYQYVYKSCKEIISINHGLCDSHAVRAVRLWRLTLLLRRLHRAVEAGGQPLQGSLRPGREDRMHACSHFRVSQIVM